MTLVLLAFTLGAAACVAGIVLEVQRAMYARRQQRYIAAYMRAARGVAP